MRIITAIRRRLCRHEWKPARFQALLPTGMDYMCGRCGKIERFYLAPPKHRLASRSPTFQDRLAAVHELLFRGDPTDILERTDRFFEEAIEVAQAFGMSRQDAQKLVDYVFDRPVGDPTNEIGAVAVTLTSLCIEAGHDMMKCAEADLEKLRRPETIERIRKKRSTRHGRGPLPGFDPDAPRRDVRGCAICAGKHDNDVLTDICTACEARINCEGSP